MSSEDPFKQIDVQATKKIEPKPVQIEAKTNPVS
jgi:hypothetical protein